MKQVTKKTMWQFAIGQLGWSILSGIMTNWLVYFYQPTDTIINEGHKLYISQGKIIFGIITMVGLITMISRIFDAITDPIIAAKSDACMHKDGRRIPFMRIAAFPLAFITVLVFVTPVQEVSVLNNIWLFVMIILFYLFLTIYCTPYNALIPELGRNEKDRINISTFISITFFIGTGLAYGGSFIWNIFINNGIERMAAIRLTFIILSIIAFICMMVPVLFIKEKDYIDVKPSKAKTYESLAATFKNKEFRIFVASDISYWIALTIFQTGLPYIITKLLGLGEEMTGIYFIVMSVVSVLFYIPVNFLAKKIGKKKLVIVAFFLFAIAFGISSLAGKTSIDASLYGYIISVLAAIPMAILGILPQAIVADIADADSSITGSKREGMFFAARTFAFKLGQSIALVIFTSLATISASTGAGYRIALLVALAFTILGAVILFFYNEKSIEKILSKFES